MQYIRSTLDFTIEDETVITFGKFDGLHRGHELLMENLFAKGRENGYRTVVFTFDIPPRSRVGQELAKVLTTNEERRYIFEQTGVDYLFECPFTEEIMCMPPEEFIRWIVEALHVRCIVVGEDFRFGYKRAGDYHVLRQFAQKYGYEVVVLDKIKEDGRDISSTFVREEILKGNMEKANHLLGYKFFVKSVVVHGRQLGRQMGIPTVNMEFPAQKLLPPNGVYVSRVQVGTMCCPGITNVGCRPTVSDSGNVGVETHIIGYEGDLYDKELTVQFLHYVRPEMKFDSVDELKSQMQRDISAAVEYYGNVTKMLTM